MVWTGTLEIRPVQFDPHGLVPWVKEHSFATNQSSWLGPCPWTWDSRTSNLPQLEITESLDNFRYGFEPKVKQR